MWWWLRRGRSLGGARVVVVGATSGIGRATALAFAGHGTRLVLVARDDAALADVAVRCRHDGATDVATCAADIGRPAGVEAVRRTVTGRFGGADVWVNLAAGLDVGSLTECPPATAERLVATNVLGPVLLSQAALTLFEAQQAGTLINVSSLLGVAANPLVPVYTTTRFAVRGLTLALQRAPHPPGVDICLVLPGPVDTPIYRHAANHSGRAVRAIPPAASPWRLAGAIVACARRPHRTVTVAGGWALLALHRVAPGLTARVVAASSAATVTNRRPTPASDGSVAASRGHGRVSGGFRRCRPRRWLGDRVGVRRARRGQVQRMSTSA